MPVPKSNIRQDRRELEKLLCAMDPVDTQPNGSVQQDSSSQQNGVQDPVANPFTEQRIFEFDYERSKRINYRKARKTVSDMASHVMDPKRITEDYVKNKMEQDIETLATLYMLYDSTIVMQQSLVETVSRGNTAPRMYEVFGQMTDKIQSINKQIVSTEQTIRKTYLDLKLEIMDKEEESNDSGMKGIGPSNGGTIEGVLVTSTKDLISMAKDRHRKILDSAKEAEIVG